MVAKENLAFVTGGNKGIGLACSLSLEKHGYKAESFSRSNGFDLTQTSDRRKLLEAIDHKKPHVFVNNAPIGFFQSEILFEVFNLFKKRPPGTRIINIGSQAAIDYPLRPENPLLYDYQKISLSKMSQLLGTSNHVIINHIDLGYTLTDRTKSLEILKEGCISTKNIEDLISWLLDLPPHLTLPHLFLRPLGKSPITQTLL